MFDILLLVMLAITNTVAFLSARDARRGRQSIVNACLSRTPQEFYVLEADSNKPAKTRKAEAAGRAIPPIGL